MLAVFLMATCALVARMGLVITLSGVAMLLGLSALSSPETLNPAGGFDVLSGSVLILTLALNILMICASTDFKKSSTLVFLYFSLVFVVSLMFGSGSLLWFYILFELSVIPLSVIVLGWGAQPERLLATLYMLLFTSVSALPFVFLILVSPSGLELTPSEEVNTLLFLPFLIKLPVYIFHIWLPKAHVEAPVYGSMILAAILLKIGAYGVLRVSTLVPFDSKLFMGVAAGLGACVCSLVALTQSDLKALIAYSSVVHMGLLVLGVALGSPWVFKASILMCLGHGVTSSGLFYAATAQYQRKGSRLIPLISGTMALSVALSLMWALLLMANLSAPPSMALYSEIGMFGGVAWVSAAGWVAAAVMVIMSLAFSISMFSSVTHGEEAKASSTTPQALSEITILFLHAVWILTGLFILKGLL